MPKPPYFERVSPEAPPTPERSLEFARPRRGELEMPELTPEEKARLRALMKKAESAEEEGRIEDAINLYQTLKADFLVIKEKKEKEKRGEKVPEAMREAVETARASLEQRLNSRFEELGSEYRFEKISSPEVPENLTPEHLEILKEFFGQNLEPAVLPKPEELHDLNEEYARVMYPENKTDEGKEREEKDKTKGLISYRPGWFDQPSDENITKSDETWSQAFLRSIRQELQTLGGSFVLIETTQKPNYADGKQHYGTAEGKDSSKDPLLPIFQEVFGKDANRFNHTWDELQERLLPKIKEKIIQTFEEKGLPTPDFEVTLAPASLSNIQMTLSHPENSKTTTSEWSSTILTDKDQKDSGRRLIVGPSDDGGAAHIDDGRHESRDGYGGARLAVVFFRKSTES